MTPLVLLYSLATHPTARKLKYALKLLYLDDTTLEGSVTDVRDDFVLIKETSREIGLELKFSKCEIFIFRGTSEERNAAKELLLNVDHNLLFPEMGVFCFLGPPLTAEV